VVKQFFVRDEALDVDCRRSIKCMDRIHANAALFDFEYPLVDETKQAGSYREWVLNTPVSGLEGSLRGCTWRIAFIIFTK